MLKPNKKYSDVPYSKKKYLFSGHFVFNFFANDIIFGSALIAKNEKWQKLAMESGIVPSA